MRYRGSCAQGNQSSHGAAPSWRERCYFSSQNGAYWYPGIIPCQDSCVHFRKYLEYMCSDDEIFPMPTDYKIVDHDPIRHAADCENVCCMYACMMYAWRHVYVYIYLCVCVIIRVCVCVIARACARVCKYACICVHSHIHTKT